MAALAVRIKPLNQPSKPALRKRGIELTEGDVERILLRLSWEKSAEKSQARQ